MGGRNKDNQEICFETLFLIFVFLSYNVLLILSFALIIFYQNIFNYFTINVTI